MEVYSILCGRENFQFPVETFKEFDAKYFSPVWSPRQWQLLKNKSHQHIAIWVKHEDIIRSILLVGYNQESGTSEIFKIVTEPNFRRMGLAKSAFTELKESLVKLGVYSVFLQVEVNNYPAIQAYTSWGFNQTRSLRNYYGQGRDGIELKYEIPSEHFTAH